MAVENQLALTHQLTQLRPGYRKGAAVSIVLSKDCSQQDPFVFVELLVRHTG